MKKLKRLKVEVTADDIAHGTRGSGSSCPIALACRRLGFNPNAIPGHMSLACMETNERWEALTPMAARIFMSEFDNNRQVAPFTFEIEAVKMSPGYDPSTEEVERELTKAKALEAANEA